MAFFENFTIIVCAYILLRLDACYAHAFYPGKSNNIGSFHVGAFVRFVSAVLVISSITFSSVAVSPDTDYVGALWVGQSDGVLKIATADGRVLFEIESDTVVETVSVDEVHGKLWIYGCNRLLAYGFDGSLLTSVPAVIGLYQL